MTSKLVEQIDILEGIESILREKASTNVIELTSQATRLETLLRLLNTSLVKHSIFEEIKKAG